MSSEQAISGSCVVYADGIVCNCVTETCDKMLSLNDYLDIKWKTWPRSAASMVESIVDSDDLAFGGKL